MTTAAAEVQSDPPADYVASPRIEHAARAVAEGEDAVRFLQDSADKAAEVVAKLDARLAAIAAKRAALIDRRAAGQGDDDEDAATLALIDADVERLQQLRIIAAHDYDNAMRAVDERRLHLRDAQREFDCATAAHQAELLEPQLRELESTLLAGIGRLATLKQLAAGMGPRQRLHARQVFAVSPALGRLIQYNVVPDDVSDQPVRRP
ncbi:MAG: hypothetical protein ABTR27_16245 [Candidatus Competibacter phosphatis]